MAISDTSSSISQRIRKRKSVISNDENNRKPVKNSSNLKRKKCYEGFKSLDENFSPDFVVQEIAKKVFLFLGRRWCYDDDKYVRYLEQ